MPGVVLYILFQRNRHIGAGAVDCAWMGHCPSYSQYGRCNNGAPYELFHQLDLLRGVLSEYVIVWEVGLGIGYSKLFSLGLQLLHIIHPVIVTHAGIGIHAFAEIDIQMCIPCFCSLFNAEEHWIALSST